MALFKARSLKRAGHVARMEEGRSTFKILTGTPTGKRSLGKCRLRWEDNIRMDLKEKYIYKRNLVDSSQDKDYWRALVNEVLNLPVPYAMELKLVLFKVILLLISRKKVICWPLSKIKFGLFSWYLSSNTFVHTYITSEAMDLPLVTLPLVGHICVGI